MGFLAPLYAAGIAAIALPILFHLIRRTPRGRIVFSSLMFLSPSPPRITRRSRLEHLLLLLLRATALILIALAFCRPFLRQIAQIGVEQPPGQRVAILVDTSASMDRGDLWSRVQREALAAVDRTGPLDQVALFTFDQQLNAVVGFDSTSELGGASARLVRAEIPKLRTTPRRTELGACLAALADLMDSDADARQLYTDLQIVLISDLQEGARLDPLQDVQWPERVRVDVRGVALEAGNAGLQILPNSESGLAQGTYRVRLVTDERVQRENWHLHWIDREGMKIGSTIELYVPAGQSRVATVEVPLEDIAGLWLANDDHPFDNTAYAASLPPRHVSVLYIGPDAADDTGGLLFYFQSALVDKGLRRIHFVSRTPDELQAADLLEPRLFLLTSPISPDQTAGLRSRLAEGAVVVVPMRDAVTAESLTKAFDLPLTSREADVDKYTMLSEIDFRHPMFAALAEPRFSDFTKIRFWRYRALELAEPFQVVARFDSRDAAIAEMPLGAGRVVVLASDWSPRDSQLAVSTKWVPLVESWLEMAAGKIPDPAFAVVGQVVALPWKTDGTASDAGRDLHTIWRTPDGSEVRLPADAKATPVPEAPGLYELVRGEQRQAVAVNLDPHELRTTPLDPIALEQFGVRLGTGVDRQAAEELARQMRDEMLEKRQGVWRWLIASAVLLLLVETWLAGRATRGLRPTGSGGDEGAAQTGNSERHTSDSGTQ